MATFDVMPDVRLYQPTTLGDALALADEYRELGWLFGGGQDTYGWLKDRVKRPQALIDLNGVGELRGIEALDSGIEIGAVTTLREILADEVVARDFGLLRDAASRVASPQIRNVGTLGGNLVQDARCWYYRRGLDCYRAGGNICYADGPQAMNREHAVFGASRCVAVSPSDTATALVALDAVMRVKSLDGERLVPAAKFFVGPDRGITRMTALKPGELLVSVKIPDDWAGAKFHFEKVADRNVFDFALVSIASALRLEDGVIDDCRLVLGGVACTPHRLHDVERAATGEIPSETLANQLAEAASQGAQPLNYNHFKIPLMQNLVKKVLRG